MSNLNAAILSGRLKEVQRALNQGADVDEVTSKGETALMIAIGSLGHGPMEDEKGRRIFLGKVARTH